MVRKGRADDPSAESEPVVATWRTSGIPVTPRNVVSVGWRPAVGPRAGVGGPKGCARVSAAASKQHVDMAADRTPLVVRTAHSGRQTSDDCEGSASKNYADDRGAHHRIGAG